MTTILQLICSPRKTSLSTALSNDVVGRLKKAYPDATVVTRNLHDLPVAHPDNDYAEELISGRTEMPVNPTGGLAVSEELINELKASDILVIGTSMNNFSLPSVLKAWIDYVVRIFATFNPTPEGKIGSLADRPVYVAVASGGAFSGPNANQPDHLTPYLTMVLGCMGLKSITYLPLQGTAYTPAEQLEEQRRTLLATLDEAIGARAAA